MNLKDIYATIISVAILNVREESTLNSRVHFYSKKMLEQRGKEIIIKKL